MRDETNSAFENLKKEKDFLQFIVDELPASIQIVKIDEDGNPMPVWTNNAYENIFGYSLEERKKMKPLEFYHPDDVKQVRDAVKQSFIDNNFRDAVVCRIKHKNRQWKWVYIFGCRLKYSDGGKYMLSSAVEITKEFTYNHTKMQQYMKEITLLKSKLTLSKLTNSEKEIICLLAKGKTVKEVAVIRERSYDTINNHKRNIFKKLGFTKLSDLICFCVENGLT